jgi:hypothetical protein
LPRLAGSEPFNALYDRSRVTRLVHSPIDDGTLPVTPLLVTYRFLTHSDTTNEKIGKKTELTESLSRSARHAWEERGGGG